MSFVSRGSAVLVSLFICAAALVGVPSSANAITVPEGIRVSDVAKRYTGSPYRYGGTTPRGFDCSGYTQYVFRKALGKKLHRTAGAQAAQGRPIPKSERRRGDLIAFTNGRGIYHVGIYLSKNRIIHASRPGKPVGVEHIWTNSYRVYRFR